MDANKMSLNGAIDRYEEIGEIQTAQWLKELRAWRLNGNALLSLARHRVIEDIDDYRDLQVWLKHYLKKDDE